MKTQSQSLDSARAGGTHQRLVRQISDRRCVRMTEDYISGRGRGRLRDWPDVAMFWKERWTDLSKEEAKTFIDFTVAVTALREIAVLPRAGRARRIAISYLERLEMPYQQSA